jgi:flagellar protein FlgJ
MSTDEKIINFIDFVYPAAYAACKQYNLPILACLAQTALETSWGTVIPGNNYFGIKAGSKWTGATVKRSEGIFRAYNTKEDSFLDWANLITTEYKNALQYRTNPEEFARAIKAGGYAEDPQYAQKLIDVQKSILKRFPDIEKENSKINWLLWAFLGGCVGYYLITKR